MKTDALNGGDNARKVVFHRVAENLYRLETSGGYCGLVKRGDKQFRRSLRTKDRKLADRRLKELREQVGNLRITDGPAHWRTLSVADIPKPRRSMPRWISTRCEHWRCRGREVHDEAMASRR